LVFRILSVHAPGKPLVKSQYFPATQSAELAQPLRQALALAQMTPKGQAADVEGGQPVVVPVHIAGAVSVADEH